VLDAERRLVGGFLLPAIDLDDAGFAQALSEIIGSRHVCPMLHWRVSVSSFPGPRAAVDARVATVDAITDRASHLVAWTESKVFLLRMLGSKTSGDGEPAGGDSRL
jgi:hypothetical protein